MKNKMILGLIAMIMLVTLIIVIPSVASEQSGEPPCGGEFTPDSGSHFAEGEAPVNHNDAQDCPMDHMSGAS